MTENTSKLESAYDAVVIGMGPAGANAAYHLGRAGMKVLALEKKVLPRAKLCAGGISAKAFPLLDFDYSSAVEQEIRSAYICFWQSGIIDYPVLEKAAGCIVDRREFDYLLAMRAKNHGVEVHDNERVTAIVEDSEFIRVSSGTSDYRCRTLIGADGVNGIAAGYLGRKSKSSLLGMEVHVPKSCPVISEYGDRLGFYFGDIPGGYGWVFPRRNDASVGIGIDAGQGADARRHMQSFLEKLKIPAEYAAEAKGYPIPVYSPFARNHYCRKNILLAGDAASFVDPITGEGIYYALKSGRDAAYAILNAGPGEAVSDIYTELIENDIVAELRAAWRLARPLYAFPKATYRLYKGNAALREKHFQIMLGNSSYGDLLGEAARTVIGKFKIRS